jgi:hypothetical protein
MATDPGIFTTVFAQMLMSQQAVIDELQTKVIKLEENGVIYGGNRYDQNGNVINNQGQGFYLDATGILKARSANFTDIQILGDSTFNGALNTLGLRSMPKLADPSDPISMPSGTSPFNYPSYFSTMGPISSGYYISGLKGKSASASQVIQAYSSSYNGKTIYSVSFNSTLLCTEAGQYGDGLYGGKFTISANITINFTDGTSVIYSSAQCTCTLKVDYTGGVVSDLTVSCKFPTSFTITAETNYGTVTSYILSNVVNTPNNSTANLLFYQTPSSSWAVYMSGLPNINSDSLEVGQVCTNGTAGIVPLYIRLN